MDYVIDGSNVLLGLRIKRVPSVRALARLLAALDAQGLTYTVWFDNSIRAHLGQHPDQLAAFDDLKRVLESASLVHMAPRADRGIQKACKEFDCPVINSSDNNDSWAFQPTIFRCRFTVDRSTVFVARAHSRTKILQASVVESFEFRGVRFPAIAGSSDIESPVVSVPSIRPKVFTNGHLLVLALDASQSMDAEDTFDGKSRCYHVNDILKKSIEELGKSAIATQLYIAVLAFSSDVVALHADETGSIFAPVRDWVKWLNNNPASYELKVDRAQTNIRLVLDRASDYIDHFRISEEAGQLARKWASAAVVTISDGAHYLKSEESTEMSKDILGHVFFTLNRSEDIAFAFVGIGAQADHDSMTAWASEATAQQKDLARGMSPPVQLVEDRLYVKVDSAEANMGRIVRSFVNVVSRRYS